MDVTLTTPEQHDFRDPTLELDAKRLQQWLDSLPTTVAAEPLREMLNMLQPLNEQHLSGEERLQLLAIYQPVVQRYYENAEPIRMRPQSMSQKERDEAIDSVEFLCLALANGYKIVVKQWIVEKKHEVDQTSFGDLLRWTLRQLAETLVHSFRFYREVPEYLYFELNQVYRLARHYGVHEQCAADSAEPSLAGIYQAICMLSLVNPFSLDEGKVDLYYRFLLQTAPRARVIPGSNWQGTPEGLFFIDLQSNAGPRHCVHLQPPMQADIPYLLDAREPLQFMHKTLLGVAVEHRKQRVETGILRALLPEVAPSNQRREQRIATAGWIEAAVGFAKICNCLRAWQAQKSYALTRWEVKDSSGAGYCLTWNEAASGLLQVGELFCIEEKDDSSISSASLFIVRWVRNKRGDSTEIGVEKVAGELKVVRFECADVIVKPGYALLVNSPDNKNQNARLVVPPGVYEKGRAMTLHTDEGEIEIRAASLQQESPVFMCFEFTVSA